MASPSTEASDETHKNKGGWIGIDLGTSNCTAAVWDLSRSRCKVLRLGHENLARPPPAAAAGGKGGKIVPSALLFYNSNHAAAASDNNEESPSQNRRSTISSLDGVSSLVGYAAIRHQTSAAANENGTNNDASKRPSDKESIKIGSTSAGTLVTSFKRVVGMTSRQANELKSSDPEFWNSLPFEAVIMDETGTEKNGDGNTAADSKGQPRGDTVGDRYSDDSFLDVLGDTTTTVESKSSNPLHRHTGIKEGVAIRIKQPLNSRNPSSKNHLVTPLEVSTILLRSIRDAASEYLTNNKKSQIQAPGFLHQDNTPSQEVLNCIIGVPAHYSHAQRSAIQNAAKNAGFTGHVGVMIESTAAAMAYGLFVSPNKNATGDADTSKVDGDTSSGQKNILVFDMGGGTTDVTIANIDFGKTGNDQTDNVAFRVVATAGDRCLGGDNVDEVLARHVWKQRAGLEVPMSSSTATTLQAEGLMDWKASEHQELIGECRRAKEDLCGNDGDDEVIGGMAESNIALGETTITITRQEFDLAIQQLIDRAEHVVDDALSLLGDSVIHEVVLVGGSTHIPTVRSMLRNKFPPPIPPELCTSISAETAVAQGLATQAALISGIVPLWELRNAMMLDVLPHSIGVWVGGSMDNGNPDGKDNGGNRVSFSKGQIIHPDNSGRDQGHCVSILEKDAPLPAMGSAAFTLAATSQSGVTVVAVERIGPGDIYQCMGVFDFLLRRTDKEDRTADKSRQVQIGMTLETSGKFIVSVFDESDPEHREKRRRYLKEKGDEIPDEYSEHFKESKEKRACSGTEIGLTLFCLIFFVLYVSARIAFSDVDILLANSDL